MTEITLTGITKVQKNAMIWAYQVDGSFTSDEFKACWNVRTLFALQHKRVILFNPSTGHYYFNPDYAREIRAKLESWGVFLCDYADDFGAWFDAHIESARQPDPLPEPPADPEDTPILPMQPISDDETLPGEPLESVTPAAARLLDVPEFDMPIYAAGGGGGVARCPRCHSEKLLFAGKDSDPIDGEMSIYFCLSCGAKYGEFEDDEPKPDPLAWTKHFRPDPANARDDYNAGFLLVRRLVCSGWTKDDVIQFVRAHLSPSDAFISGMQSFFFKSYRHEVRYCNWYHWQNESAREKWENHPANYIPF